MKDIVVRGLFIGLACWACGPAGAQPAAVNPVDKFPDHGSWTLTNSDFRSAPEFARKLTTHADPTSLFLWEALVTNTRVVLDDYVPGRHVAYGSEGLQEDASMLEVLLPKLNSLISGPLIYQEGRFSPTNLAEDTRQLLAKHPTGNALAHLNRMLLEDAYPELLAKGTRIISDPGHARFAVVDFRAQFITFYTGDGKKISETDVRAAMDREHAAIAAMARDIPFWNLDGGVFPTAISGFSFRGGQDPYVSVGKETATINVKTGALTYQGSD